MSMYKVIDLTHTDDESDYEDTEPNVYVDDGFVDFDGEDNNWRAAAVSSTRGDIIPDSDIRQLDERADELWFAMLKRQAVEWVDIGCPKRTRDELLYKMGQFKTQKGKTEFVATLVNEYNIA